MNSNYLMLDLNDPRSNAIAEILSNKTAKRIVGLLVEKELSQTELSQQLKLPASTVDYNMKKLVASGLVEQTRALWSSKGKKVPVYRVSEKKIVISPKTMTRGVIPAVLVSLVAAAALKFAFTASGVAEQGAGSTAPAAADMMASKTALVYDSGATHLYTTLSQLSDVWAWFLLGSLTALAVFLLWNWSKK